MTARRLHAPDLPERGGIVTLEHGPSGHVRVLRLRVGDPVVLFARVPRQVVELELVARHLVEELQGAFESF